MNESAASRNRRKNSERAAAMKAQGVCRTTGLCAICYRLITVDSWKSRYTHICK